MWRIDFELQEKWKYGCLNAARVNRDFEGQGLLKAEEIDRG